MLTETLSSRTVKPTASCEIGTLETEKDIQSKKIALQVLPFISVEAYTLYNVSYARNAILSKSSIGASVDPVKNADWIRWPGGKCFEYLPQHYGVVQASPTQHFLLRSSWSKAIIGWDISNYQFCSTVARTSKIRRLRRSRRKWPVCLICRPSIIKPCSY